MEIIQNDQMPDQSQLPEPSVSGVFGHSWEVLKKNLPELLLVMFIQILLSLPIGVGNSFFDMEFDGSVTYSMFTLIYSVLVLMPVNFGTSWVFLKAVRGEPFRVQDIFFAYQRFGQIIFANILIFLIVGIGLVMLIVPGIIFACKLTFVPYLVMDKKMDAADAVRKSWQMTKGHAGTIFLMAIVSFFVALGGLICFIVGIFPAVIWISLAFAAIYWVVAEKDSQQQTH